MISPKNHPPKALDLVHPRKCQVEKPLFLGTGILAPGLPHHQRLAGSDHDAIAVTVALGGTVNTTGTVSAVGAAPATEASTAVQVMGLKNGML